MSSTTSQNNYFKSDYLHPSTNQYSCDSKQSPLALLAQTCSSIGKESTSPSPNSQNTKSNPFPSSINSHKAAETLSFKRCSTPSSTVNTKTSSTNNSSISNLADVNMFSSTLFNPSSTTNAFIHSSLPYLTMQQSPVHAYSSSCSLSGCLQCQTIGQLLMNSINRIHPFFCHWYSCNARFATNDELIEHVRRNHASSGKYNSISSNYNPYRYHPYLKPTVMFNSSDNLPYFYPHLSLSNSSKRTNSNGKS